LEDIYLMIQRTFTKHSDPISSGLVKVEQKSQGRRLSKIASIVLLSTFLAACESSQLLDVSGLLSSQPDTTETTAATPNDTGAKTQASGETLNRQTATGEGGTEEKIVLGGPETNVASNSKPFPSLSEQPDKPEKTLNVAEKDREIRELEGLSKTHVKSREQALENRTAAPAQKKQSDEGSIFGLGWLNSGKTKLSKANNKEGLTPPEKLRLSRIRPTNPEVESTPDNFSTGSTSTPVLGSGCARPRSCLRCRKKKKKRPG